MKEQILCFDFLEIRWGNLWIIFPLLFFLALLFPPLLLFILVSVLSAPVFFFKALRPAERPALTRLTGPPYLRSPPLFV
jgi:hypothetical protein